MINSFDDESSDKKIYELVYEKILNDASTTGVPVGGKLPSIKKMAAQYGVSETPVRMAVQELIRHGYVKSMRRSGLYVARMPESQSPHALSDDPGFNYALPFSSIKKSAPLRISLFEYLPKQKKIWHGIVKEFQQANPGMAVSVQYAWTGLAVPELLNQVDGTRPDIIQLGHREVIDFIANKKIQALPANAFPIDEFPETSLAEVITDAGIWGIPLNIFLPFQLVNKGILDKLSISIDAENYCFDDFVNACGTLKSAQDKGNISSDILPLASHVNPFQYLAAYAGLAQFEDDKTPNWRAPAIMTFFEKMSKVHRPKREVGMPWNALRETFMGGKALFLTSYAFFYDDLPDFARVLPLPTESKGKILYGANYHSLNAGSEKFTETIQFFKFLCSPQVREWVGKCDATHVLSPKVDGGSALREVENSMLPKAVSCMACGVRNYDSIIKCFFPVIDGVREGSLSPQEAVAILERSFNHA